MNVSALMRVLDQNITIRFSKLERTDRWKSFQTEALPGRLSQTVWRPTQQPDLRGSKPIQNILLCWFFLLCFLVVKIQISWKQGFRFNADTVLIHFVSTPIPSGVETFQHLLRDCWYTRINTCSGTVDTCVNTSVNTYWYEKLWENHSSTVKDWVKTTQAL